MIVMMKNELDTLRSQIDVIDERLLELLAQRAELVDAIGRYKKARGLEPLDETRWRQVLSANVERAKRLGICPEFTESLYDLIHNYSLHLESNSEPQS